MRTNIPFPMFTVGDAERAAGLPTNMAYYYIKRGELEAVRCQDGFRVTYDAQTSS